MKYSLVDNLDKLKNKDNKIHDTLRKMYENRELERKKEMLRERKNYGWTNVQSEL